MASILYRIEIVGGKHDGVVGMYWNDDGSAPPPERIVVGTCPGNGECAGGYTGWCHEAAVLTGSSSRRPHPSFWTPDEGFTPRDGQRYRRSKIEAPEGRCSCQRPGGQHAGECGAVGRAVYVALGVPMLDPEAEKALTVDDILKAAPRVPEPATFAGARGGVDVAMRQLVQLGRWLFEGRHDQGWPK